MKWHIVEVFAVSSAKSTSVYVTVPLFWTQLGRSRLLRVLSPPCLAYYTILSFSDNDGDGRRFHHMIMSDPVVPTMEWFLHFFFGDLAICKDA